MGDQSIEAEKEFEQDESDAPLRSWERWVEKRLPVYGHRNWVVVADAAYPAQSGGGIETFALDLGQDEVVGLMLARLGAARHVRPIVYVDAEMAFVSEADAPGITAYREWLHNALGELISTALPHEEIIAKLDRAGQTFCVTIIKTTMTIPYTTVFFELDCGYWNREAEDRLREAMR